MINTLLLEKLFSDGGLLVVANNDEINSWVAKQGNGKKWIGATDLVIYDMTLGQVTQPNYKVTQRDFLLDI